MRATRSRIVSRQETTHWLPLLLVSPGTGWDVGGAAVRYGNADTYSPYATPRGVICLVSGSKKGLRLSSRPSGQLQVSGPENVVGRNLGVHRPLEASIARRPILRVARHRQG